MGIRTWPLERSVTGGRSEDGLEPFGAEYIMKSSNWRSSLEFRRTGP